MMNSGDHDLVVPFLATQAWIKSLNYSIIHEWRPWMIKDQIAGYIIYFCVVGFSCSFIFSSYLKAYKTPQKITHAIFFLNRYTRTYSNKMTFATVKASLLSKTFILVISLNQKYYIL